LKNGKSLRIENGILLTRRRMIRGYEQRMKNSLLFSSFEKNELSREIPSDGNFSRNESNPAGKFGSLPEL
jgi:hypothetical protein